MIISRSISCKGITPALNSSGLSPPRKRQASPRTSSPPSGTPSAGTAPSGARVTALNGSGRAAQALTPELLSRTGVTAIALDSPHSVTVPGTVAAWADLLARHGTRSLAEVLQPAIGYAHAGFPVTPVIAASWQRLEAKLRRRPSGAELLPVAGRAPRAGELARLPELARTLQSIAEGGAESFYRGETARRIAAFVQSLGGLLAAEDFAAHCSTWDTPLSLDYRGVRVWQCPPNGQGLAALLALGIIQHDDLAALPATERWHLLIEAMRLAFADARQWVADPVFTPLPLAKLLDPAYAATRRGLIDMRRALPQVPCGLPAQARGPLQPFPRADTVYLSVVDGTGNACSWINSLYYGFGSGLVVPGTGIALQNRGALFDLHPDHPNCLAAGKRPYHTIIPGLATKDDALWASFGVMGGFMQPQGQVQVLVNMLDLGMTPQAALEAPRFCLLDGDPAGRVAVEQQAGSTLLRGLRARGHDVQVLRGMERMVFGAGQIIRRAAASGVLTGGSEPRRDGCALGF